VYIIYILHAIVIAYKVRYHIAMQVIKAVAASRGIISIFGEHQTQNIA